MEETMKSNKWLRASVMAAFFLTSGFALAQGQGHGKGHDKDKHGGDDRSEHFYRDHDRDEMRDWYHAHYQHLPPGLAKRDELPPGLERQLIARGTLPPGLQKKIEPCPPELVRVLPPPPPDCEHVVIGGHVVLLNRRNFMVVDVFHFELD
jgi:hypothetical protein